VTPPGAGSAAGPLAEEAARLVEAMSQWAREHAGPVAGDLADHVGGAEECRLCPFCQAIALMRSARPETYAHLLEAATAMAAAMRSVAETAGRRGGGSAVTRIDLDDDVEPRAGA
jgi:hypothetical protein